jgi:hypothetical protein
MFAYYEKIIDQNHKNSAKRFKIQTLVILLKNRLELRGACVWEITQDVTPIHLWLMHSIFILLGFFGANFKGAESKKTFGNNLGYDLVISNYLSP